MGGGDAIGDPIIIRFDGLDADKHEIELAELADSLKGIARILSVTGNFAATFKFYQHRDALDIKVVAKPPQAHCFELWAVVRWCSENPLIAATVSGLLVAAIGYTVKKAIGDHEEMKHLRASLETAIKELGARDPTVVNRLLDTVDKMADALRPAVRQAVAPIGTSARTLTLGAGSAAPVVIDEAQKAAIMSGGDVSVDDERNYVVSITELDVDTGSCKVRLEGEPERRYPAKITDPTVTQPNNPYALALASQSPLTVRAKATSREGALERLFISNTA